MYALFYTHQNLYLYKIIKNLLQIKYEKGNKINYGFSF